MNDIAIQLRLALLAVITLTGFTGCATRPGQKPAESAPSTQIMRTTDAQDRPGLGTGWGEPRESWVETAYFARAWENRPSGMEKLFYNDRAGVDAMVNYLGGDPEPAPGPQRAAGGLVRVGLRDNAGRWYDAVARKGQRFVIGELGSRYEVVVQNETRRPVEVVLSVDGFDAVDGQSASLRKRGYVIAPRQSLTVDGFRTNERSVSAFRFTRVGDTYAQRRQQQTGNVGVIGLAVFTERMFGTPAEKLRPEHRAIRQVDTPGAAQRTALPDA